MQPASEVQSMEQSTAAAAPAAPPHGAIAPGPSVDPKSPGGGAGIAPPPADAEPVAPGLDVLRDTAADLAAWLGSAGDMLVDPTRWGRLFDWLAARIDPVAEQLIAVALAGLFTWWWQSRRRGRRRGEGSAPPATDPLPLPSAATTRVPPATLASLRDLLLQLPCWNDARSRQNFIESCFFGQPLLGQVRLDGRGLDVAHELAVACMAEDARAPAGQRPVCALLAAVSDELGSHPARAGEIAKLRAALGCD